jgi:hypothetical protein
MAGPTLELSVELEVGQHERLRVRPTLERDTRSLATRAVCPIAADEIAAAHMFRPSVIRAKRAGDFLAVGREADELDATLDRGA